MHNLVGLALFDEAATNIPRGEDGRDRRETMAWLSPLLMKIKGKSLQLKFSTALQAKLNEKLDGF